MTPIATHVNICIAVGVFSIATSNRQLTFPSQIHLLLTCHVSDWNGSASINSKPHRTRMDSLNHSRCKSNKQSRKSSISTDSANQAEDFHKKSRNYSSARQREMFAHGKVLWQECQNMTKVFYVNPSRLNRRFSLSFSSLFHRGVFYETSSSSPFLDEVSFVSPPKSDPFIYAGCCGMSLWCKISSACSKSK